MKRHLISDEISEKDDHRRCATNLVILGNCRTLIGEDLDISESEHRNCKKPKLQSQQGQETSTKIEDDHKDNGNDSHIDIDDPKLRYQDFVSSAVTLLRDERRKLEKRNDCAQQQQQQHQHQHQPERREDQTSSGTSTTTRSSRSDSLSSEHSVYRSYEMKLPDQQFATYSNEGRLLPSPPRLSTASDVPRTKDATNNSCWLNTRRYGDDFRFREGGQTGCYYLQNHYGNKIHTIENKTNLTKCIRLQTVIYH